MDLNVIWCSDAKENGIGNIFRLQLGHQSDEFVVRAAGNNVLFDQPRGNGLQRNCILITRSHAFLRAVCRLL